MIRSPFHCFCGKTKRSGIHYLVFSEKVDDQWPYLVTVKFERNGVTGDIQFNHSRLEDLDRYFGSGKASFVVTIEDILENLIGDAKHE